MVTQILATNPGDATFYNPKIYFPAGKWQIDADINFDLKVSAASSVARRRLTIQGDSEGGTLIKMAGTWSVKNGHLTLRDMRLRGGGTNTLFKLGDTHVDDAGTEYVNQFKIANVQFFSYGIAIQGIWLFDGSIEDCGFFGTAIGGAACDFPLHNSDCSNNIAWRRCHFEKYTASILESDLKTAFIRTRGQSGIAGRQPGRFTFDACHFESRRYDILAFDLEFTNNVTLMGSCQVLQSSGGDGPTADGCISYIRLIGISGFSMLGASAFARDAFVEATPWAHALFSLGGSTRGVTATGTFFQPNSGVANESSSALWESDLIVPFVEDGGPGIILGQGVNIATRNGASITSNTVGLVSSSLRNRRWALYNNDTSGQDLTGHYTNDSTWLGQNAPNFRFSNDGALKMKSGYVGYDTSTIASGASKTFELNVAGNTAKVALWMIYANTTGGNGYALVMSMGTAGVLTTINSGSTFSVASPSSSTVNPGVSGKVNVYLDGGDIAVNNQYSGTIRVSAIPFGMHFGT